MVTRRASAAVAAAAVLLSWPAVSGGVVQAAAADRVPVHREVSVTTSDPSGDVIGSDPLKRDIDLFEVTYRYLPDYETWHFHLHKPAVQVAWEFKGGVDKPDLPRLRMTTRFTAGSAKYVLVATTSDLSLFKIVHRKRKQVGMSFTEMDYDRDGTASLVFPAAAVKGSELRKLRSRMVLRAKTGNGRTYDATVEASATLPVR